MPTYEFRCPEGHEFEKFYRSIGGAEAQSACPVCGALSERMMSATGFAFKGSGFYLTDYGKNAHRDKGTPTPASPASNGDGGRGESKAESGGGDGGAKSDGAKGDASAPASASASAGSGGPAPAKAAEAKPAPAPTKPKSTE